MNTETILERSIGSYWIFESFHRGPGNMYEGKDCMITVVLDDGLVDDYSGIRLIVVYDQSELTGEGLYLKRIRDLRPFRIPSLETSDELSIRSGDVPICNVILQLYNTYMLGGGFEHLRLRPIQICDLSDRRRNWRIAYDSIHAFQSDSSPASLVRLLHFDRSFIERLHHASLRPISETMGLFVWNYRILSISEKKRNPQPNLPSPIVMDIVRHTVDMLTRDWPKQLLRFSTVSKNWRKASDVVLEFSEYLDTSYLITFSKFLRSFPEKAIHVKKLNISFYSWYPSLVLNDLLEASISIMSLTTELQSLRLSWSGREFYTVLPILRHLKSLAYIELIGLWPCSFSFIQSVLPESENELHLSLKLPVEFQASVTSQPADQIESEKALLERSTWNVTLGALKLSYVPLTPLELTRCVPQKSVSLSEVYFMGVFGVTNQDLLVFLSAISQSVRRLWIMNCTFPLLHEEEALAIDAVMESMVALEYAELSSCVVTTLSIARKPALANKLPQREPQPCKVYIGSCLNRYYAVTECEDTRFMEGMDAFIPALERTGWSVVGLGEPFENLPREAKDVARARDISLVNSETWYKVHGVSI